jgi:excisionase family DNA binding protein
MTAGWHRNRGPGSLLRANHDLPAWQQTRCVVHPYRLRLDDRSWCYDAEPYNPFEEAFDDLAYLRAHDYRIRVGADLHAQLHPESTALLSASRASMLGELGGRSVSYPDPNGTAVLLVHGWHPMIAGSFSLCHPSVVIDCPALMRHVNGNRRTRACVVSMKPRRSSYLFRAGEGWVIIPPRIAKLIEARTTIKALRLQLRGVDPEATAVLEDLHAAALSWRGFPETETVIDSERKPAADSTWLSSGKAAATANVSRQAIGNAIRQKRLPAAKINGRYKISRQDLDQWRATRPRQR